MLSSPTWSADCPTGNCPGNANELSCRAASAPLPRQGIDPNAPVVWTFGESEFDGQHLIRLSNGVELRQDQRVLRSPEMTYDEQSGRLSVPGAVELSDPNLIVRGAGARGSTIEGTVEFSNTTFSIPAREGHGAADTIRLSKEGEVDLLNARYTTCPGDNPAWQLEVGRLSIDAQAHEGSARNAWIEVKGIPVFYVPYISFPVGNERKSGLLFPSIGNSSRSGRQVSIPWYWNIAPNYDATITPTWYSQRGIDFGTELRLLTESSRALTQINYLPNEHKTGLDRSYIELHDQTDFASELRLYVDGTNVSDRNWLEDFGTGTQRSGVAVLQRQAQLVYRSDQWLLMARAQNYQTIDPDLSINERPYALLPQVTFDGWFPDLAYGLAFSADGEYSNFRRSTNSTAAQGQRLDLRPEFSLPLRRGGIYVQPSAAFRYTTYRYTPSAADETVSVSRSAPIFSVDSGVVFERISGHSQQRIQTLEPRLLYLYVPYRAQSDLPVFDTKLPDFNLIQLFRTNRYVGPDRLGDANQIAYGVTSRLLDRASGEQFLTATIGEVYRFSTPKVTLPGETIEAINTSDIIGQLSLTAYKNWNAGVGVQWDPSEKRMQRLETTLQFRMDSQRVVNVGYVYRHEGLAQQPGLKQAYVSTAWPVGASFSLYGRYVYSLLDRTMIDGLAGFEYRGCCWASRLGIRRNVSLTGQLENAWQWQIELNGLASVGTANDAFLAQAIRGYSAARFDRQSVP